MPERSSFSHLLAREARNVWHKYIHSDAESWQRVYSQHYRDKLDSLDQRARHYIVAGAIRERLPLHAKILDVGCGCGTTYGMLADYPGYHGIDLAPAAIQACVATFPHRASSFEVA